jgi:hypothetical protein
MPPEPPYRAIGNLLKRGKVIPFLGAGASLSGRPLEAKWADSRARFLPTGRELSRWLAEESEFPSAELSDREDLAKVASYYQESVDRPSLIELLREVFSKEYEPGQVHHFLAELSTPLLIVITNYDALIERAFEAKRKPYHLVVHPTDRAELAASVLWWKPGEVEPKDYPPQLLPLTLTDTTIIYKMHGSVHRRPNMWDSFVITEEDYVEFLARMTGQSAIPARFMLHFRASRFLFLGYGLNDWNLRVMLKNLKTVLVSPKGDLPEAGGDLLEARTHMSIPDKNLRSWAIQYRPAELDTMLWGAQRVNIYDMDINTFIARMRERIN